MDISIRRAAVTTTSIILVFILPVFLTLNSVTEPVMFQPLSDDPTPLGYTISLAMFIFPMIVLGWWFYGSSHLENQKSAFFFAILLLVPLGVILDVFFGNTFFIFINHNAVTGITFPAVGGALPVEELVFYGTGFVTVLLIYIWCDEFWLEKYNIADYFSESKNIPRLLKFHLPSLIIGGCMIIAAIIYNKTVYAKAVSFPWYFIYITIFALIPSMALYPSTQRFINWRAFSFTFFIIVLISLIWEVTLALPYQWWGYRDSAMTGIFIQVWHNLPIEAVVIWFSVCYASIIIYEAMKIWKASDKTAKIAFLG